MDSHLTFLWWLRQGVQVNWSRGLVILNLIEIKLPSNWDARTYRHLDEALDTKCYSSVGQQHNLIEIKLDGNSRMGLQTIAQFEM
jgi:hypothetical protein